MPTYIKVLIILIFGLIATYLFSFMIAKGSNRYHNHTFAQVKEIYDSKDYFDIVYLGSSRTHQTIHPGVVDSITGLKSYNIGVDGGNMFEFKMTFDGYMESHPPPKYMVFTIDAASLDISRRMFLPIKYFNFVDKPSIKKAFQQQENYSYFLLRYLPFMRVIYYDDYIKGLAIRGLAGQNELKTANKFDFNGYLSNGDECVDAANDVWYAKTRPPFDSLALSYLNSIVRSCKEKNVQLIFTYAPEFSHRLQRSIENFNDFITLISGIAERNNIPFYRDDQLPLCNDPCLFANYGHVNTKGAQVYSAVLGNRLKDLISVANRP